MSKFQGPWRPDRFVKADEYFAHQFMSSQDAFSLTYCRNESIPELKKKAGEALSYNRNNKFGYPADSIYVHALHRLIKRCDSAPKELVELSKEKS